MTAGERSSTSLRPLGVPRALAVRTDTEGEPVAVARTDARGRPGPELTVERVDEVWRLAEAWWREAPQRRTYYRVILDGTRPLTMFRDDAAGAWFEQPYTAPEATGIAP